MLSPLLFALAITLSPSVTMPTAPAMPAGAIQTTLLAPTGIRPVGSVSIHLIDNSRRDPWIASQPKRELMISLWYPALPGGSYPRVPWLSPRVAEIMLQAYGVPPGIVEVPQTHGLLRAPVDTREGAMPVIVFSPGYTASRSSNTLMVEELASRGYIVATIDHTHDADAVEFPDGHIEVRTLPDAPTDFEPIVAVRTADVRFVLNALTLANFGINPDADRQPMPDNLRGAMDLRRIGMFGTSMGGSTTMSAMQADSRIRAGLTLDSVPQRHEVHANLNRPFLMINAKANRTTSADLATFWDAQRGWKRDLRMTGAAHLSYSDFVWIIPQVWAAIGLSPDDLADLIGSVDPLRAVAVQRSYPLAFFDLHLRSRACTDLFDGPSPFFPEVQFVP